MTYASGTFEVTLTPQAAPDGQDPVGQLRIDKVFHGDLTGTSAGYMLSVGTATPGSAGYVAVEVVQATLHGRTGSFALQHSGTLARGTAQLSVTVVPDSGTDQLVGLIGTLVIDRAASQHTYGFDYELTGPATDG